MATFLRELDLAVAQVNKAIPLIVQSADKGVTIVDDGNRVFNIPCSDGGIVCKITWAVIPGRYEAIEYDMQKGTIGEEVCYGETVEEIIDHIAKVCYHGGPPRKKVKTEATTIVSEEHRRDIDRIKDLVDKHAPGRKFDPDAIKLEEPNQPGQYASGFGAIKGGKGRKLTYSFDGVEVIHFGRITTKIDDVDWFTDKKVVIDGKVILDVQKV